LSKLEEGKRSMRAFITVILAALWLAAGAVPLRAADNPLIGTWTAKDPSSGGEEQLVIKAETLQFGADEPEVPYTAQGDGNAVSIFIGGPGNPPATFTFLGPDSAELAVPDGPTIALTRAAAAPLETAAGTPDAAPSGEDAATGDVPPGRSMLDELSEALVPYGVSTRYEPLNQSLEALLSSGWKLDQAAGASGAFTLLLTKGSSNALCVLVPKDLGQASTALSDCRLLN
jgi:hypothetical protein